MVFTTAEIGAWLGGLLWPLVRVSAFLMAMPLLTTRGVPMQARLILSLAVGFAIAQTLPPAPAVDPVSIAGMLIVIQQVVIGITMGFILRLVFAAMVNAGHLTALGMGLGFASMVDPTNGVQVPVVSMFYNILGILLFLSFDGHLVAIQVLAESFRVLPVGNAGLALRSFYDVVLWGSWMFSGAVLLALPAMTAILMINLAFGVMTRASPQLNIFSVGFPVIITAGFLVMLLTLGSAGEMFVELTEQALALLREIVARGAG